MAIHCFYHSADLDGHCSGAIVKYRYPEAIMHPINYGQEFPWEEIHRDDDVIMVDFCLQPEEKMLQLGALLQDLDDQIHEREGTLYWIDHHKSSIEAVKALGFDPYGKRDTSKAACELTWEYLFPNLPVPLAVKLLSLYDSWTYKGHELEDKVLPFQMFMRMRETDPKLDAFDWEVLLDDLWPNSEATNTFISYAVRDGKLLLRYDEKQKRKYVQTYGFETELLTDPWDQKVWGGDAVQRMYGKTYKAIAVNLGHTNSKIFDSVWRRECPECFKQGEKSYGGFLESCRLCDGTGYIEPYDLMITFCRRSDKRWNVSLYSTKENIDCGAIAKTFGGGGHKDAAGFRCDELPFEH